MKLTHIIIDVENNKGFLKFKENDMYIPIDNEGISSMLETLRGAKKQQIQNTEPDESYEEENDTPFYINPNVDEDGIEKL